MNELTLAVNRLLGTATRQPAGVLPGGEGFAATQDGDGMEMRFAAGTLTAYKWLTCDALLEGDELAVFSISLYEAGTDNFAEMHFGFLNHCQARVRVPLHFVHQNRWMYDREGAYLKPCAGGKRVSLEKVDRITFTLFRHGNKEVRWAMTPLLATVNEPSLLTDPLLPKGPLLDELGQSTLHQWPARTRDAAECTARLQRQLAEAPHQRWPSTFARWGGFAKGPRHKATGAFRTHQDDAGRWWLVDPEGYLFWSAGIDCMSPRGEANVTQLDKALTWLPPRESDYAAAFNTAKHVTKPHFSYFVANYIRAFGKDDWFKNWATISVSQMRAFGFNTLANWGDWRVAKAAGFPYVRPLNEHFATTPKVFRDFPDVFHANFATDCATYAQQLEETRDDPAFIGYFLMNEPTWGFAQETPALGMIYNNERSETRTALAAWLRERYGTAATLSEKWGVACTFEDVATGHWTRHLGPQAYEDLTAFSTVMVDKLYRTMTEACRKVDPQHMNLGARYYTVPPEWCLTGMSCFDVFSLNAYSERIPGEQYKRIASALKRPVLAGEWHFGALDAGLPASGIGHVPTQADRGRAYRIYLEDAAANPACIGVHYFQMYDQSALGRFDGENYQIGFIDVCNRPYEDSATAARAAHEAMYAVRLGVQRPFSDAPEYLPKLFI